MRGQFRIWKPRPSGVMMPEQPDIIIPNLVTDEGEDEFLKMIFQDVTEIAGGGNWYIGLCNQMPNKGDGLADIDTEPSSAGGYARQAVPRSAVGWPTIGEVNGHKYIRSATTTFSATGADFDTPYSRLFLTDASSGTSGVLYAISGKLTTPITVPDGQSTQVQYEFFLS